MFNPIDALKLCNETWKYNKKRRILDFDITVYHQYINMTAIKLKNRAKPQVSK